ncbi:hypothetical protein QBC38DRAFT_548856 [Podospora fimiseda]|uniref:Uncharacterized protein n=1 Tax=Podospora fimiseda TaxID=252190 RepID=A0AAN6YP97_9PEZI|nr:hypothetical protein QBC38DRAFT_548856 [Podospora fimiseda]
MTGFTAGFIRTHQYLLRKSDNIRERHADICNKSWKSKNTFPPTALLIIALVSYLIALCLLVVEIYLSSKDKEVDDGIITARQVFGIVTLVLTFGLAVWYIVGLWVCYFAKRESKKEERDVEAGSTNTTEEEKQKKGGDVQNA